MTKQITSEEVVQKIYNKLRPSGWNNALHTYLLSSEFKSLIDQLQQEVDNGYRFYPQVQNMFRFLTEVPTYKIKCVVLVDNNSKQGVPLIRDADRKDVSTPITEWEEDNDKEVEDNALLTRYTKQGILVIPTICTIGVGNKHHKEIWKSWPVRIIEKINEIAPEAPWVIHTRVYKYESYIVTDNKIKVENRNIEKNIGDWVNEIVEKNGKKAIKW